MPRRRSSRKQKRATKPALVLPFLALVVIVVALWREIETIDKLVAVLMVVSAGLLTAERLCRA